MTETVTFIVIVGVSLEYCVHIAVDYRFHVNHVSRKIKMKNSYQNIGGSLLSGAIISIGSVAFLYGATLSIF